MSRKRLPRQVACYAHGWPNTQKRKCVLAFRTSFANISLRRLTMRFNVTLDRDEDGVWIAECPSIPGCVSQGKTKQEAVESIKEAIALCLEVRADKGLPLTIETQQVEVAA